MKSKMTRKVAGSFRPVAGSFRPVAVGSGVIMTL
jgi:hypothetical protein